MKTSGAMNLHANLSTPGDEPNGDYLKAQSACMRLVVASTDWIDGGMAMRVRPLFVSDGVHAINGREFAGEALTKLFEQLESVQDRRTHHCVNNASFEWLSEDRAEMKWTCIVYDLSQTEETRRLIPKSMVAMQDSFIRQPNGKWMFTRRDARHL
jgi:hypothetical protein